MFKISEIYSNNRSGRFEIEKKENLYSLKLNGKTLKEGYENIFSYGDNLFVLVSGGNFGAVQYDEKLNEVWSLPCEYITLDEYWHNLIFSKDEDIVYYNAESKEWRHFNDVYISGEFLYGENTEVYIIIEQATGKCVWYEIKEEGAACDPCYIFCGRANGYPRFYDVANASYARQETPNWYAKYINYPSLTKPIIVNGVNVINICQENGKIGTIDEINKNIIRPQWDEISIDLKVTCRDGSNQQEEVFHITDIKAGDVIPFEEW